MSSIRSLIKLTIDVLSKTKWQFDKRLRSGVEEFKPQVPDTSSLNDRVLEFHPCGREGVSNSESR